MPGIKDAMSDILAQLQSVPIINGDGSTAPPYVRVWNNQLKYDQEGNMESFPKPAFFLQVISPATYEVIGQGYRSANINFRIHIIQEYYNDGDGVTYEQDLDVFELRDNLIILLTYFTPSGCGPMTCVAEDQDDTHNNLYHYILDFPCNFTDSKGSRDDQGRNVYVETTVPTDATIQVQKDNVDGSDALQRKFLIPKR